MHELVFPTFSMMLSSSQATEPSTSFPSVYIACLPACPSRFVTNKLARAAQNTRTAITHVFLIYASLNLICDLFHLFLFGSFLVFWFGIPSTSLDPRNYPLLYVLSLLFSFLSALDLCLSLFFLVFCLCLEFASILRPSCPKRLSNAQQDHHHLIICLRNTRPLSCAE